MIKTPCPLAPKPWICTRNAGHFGPCAAVRAERSDVMQSIGEAISTRLEEMAAADWYDAANIDEVLDVIEPIVSAPIRMVLHCPKCHEQHIDAPDPFCQYSGGECPEEPHWHSRHWTNPPHKSHMCAGCGWIWRPADVATTGVQAIETKGRNDGKEGA